MIFSPSFSGPMLNIILKSLVTFPSFPVNIIIRKTPNIPSPKQFKKQLVRKYTRVEQFFSCSWAKYPGSKYS